MSMAEGSTKTFRLWKRGIKAGSTQIWWVITAGSYNGRPIPHTSSGASVSHTSEHCLHWLYWKEKCKLEVLFLNHSQWGRFPDQLYTLPMITMFSCFINFFFCNLFMFLVCILHIIHTDQSLLCTYDVREILSTDIRCTMWRSAITKYLI